MRRAAGALAALVLALALPPARAGASNGADPAVAAALYRLFAADARLQSVGWRLVSGNAPYCADARPGAGLLLLDAANFRDPPAIRAALGLAGDIAVNAVAAGSPAERAGLRPGETVLAIGPQAMAALPPAPAGDSARLDALHNRLDALLAAGPVPVLVRSADGAERSVTVKAQAACPSRFVLGGASLAVADGDRVILDEAALAVATDDALLAAIVAHELAHNLLRHRERLARTGRDPATVRATEHEADRLAPWLLANAGFPPEAAIRLAERRAAARPLDALLPAATHGSWRGRARTMAAEVDAIGALRQANPAAPLDWRTRFAVPPRHDAD